MSEGIVTKDFLSWIDQIEMPNGKKKVILAALQLFAEQGFDGTSTQQIAEKSGMSQATIFKYFKTKEDLLRWIIQPILKNIIPLYVRDFKNQLSDKNADLTSTIHFVVRNRYQFLVDNQQVAMIVLSELLTRAEVKEAFVSTIKQQGQSLVEIFQNLLLSTGEVASDIDTVAIIRLVVSQVLGYFLQTQKLFPDTPQSQVDQDLAEIEKIIVRAIKKS